VNPALFSADRTAAGEMLSPSICLSVCLSVMKCIVALRVGVGVDGTSYLLLQILLL